MHVGALRLLRSELRGSTSVRPFCDAKNSGASALHRDAILSDKTCRPGLTRGFTGRVGTVRTGLPVTLQRFARLSACLFPI
jgi:hypothetical protein